jgi:hypothetical protein
MIDFQKFCQEQHIPVADRSDKHFKAGWVNVMCPFCVSNGKYLLGLKIGTQRCNCWQCGWHPLRNTVAMLTGTPLNAVWKLLQQYDRGWIRKAQKEQERQFAAKCVFPAGTTALQRHHVKYLESRGFDIDKLSPWGLKATGPVGPYKHRIIAPIRYHDRLISYQGRDFTGKAKLKYKACKQEREVIAHQNMLYGFDLVPGNTCVVVEGITDAWKLGPGAVATFGIDWTEAQAQLLMNFEHVIIMFDSEPTAQAQARSLAKRLYVPDILNPELVELEKFTDPGDLPLSEAYTLMEEFGIR